MSYYFAIISPRDAPLYEAHLSSKPSGTSSFFASSGSTASPSTPTAATAPAPRASGESGGVFGFAASLQALAGGLRGDASDGAPGAGGARAAGGQQGNKLGFGRYGAAETLQMIAHSSLDAVEDRMITSGNL